MRRVCGHLATRLVDHLLQQHPLRGARLAGQFRGGCADAQEQGARADRLAAAIEPHHAALAGHEAAAGGCPQRGEADPFQPGHRNQHRGRVVGQVRCRRCSSRPVLLRCRSR
ncbi:hypothetical protein G6F53_013909 [Rhizopus delemar]|nr:hypothetical protein G6F53_013909 [Rhizopus delemar]